MSQHRVRTSTRPKLWPSPQDYNEAIQELSTNTSDPSLRSCTVEVNSLGLPMPRTGAFASVYKVQSQAACHALRCFLRDISDQEQRYALISDFVQNDSLPYTVTFHYLSEGLRVNGLWYPALKMDWVTGLTLDSYVERNIGTPLIPQLADKFKRMCYELQRDGIAHGDLQHGNILICDDEIRLVDYDGMFVPAMKGWQCNEVGHRNYQHPRRRADHFDSNLDNFSAWVIYASLRAIALDPQLYPRLGGGDDCLLFRRRDFLRPEQSPAFSVLEHHEIEEIRDLARTVRWLCSIDPNQVPPLADAVPALPEMPDLPSDVNDTLPSLVYSDRATGGSILPDWIASIMEGRNAKRIGSRDTYGGFNSIDPIPPAHPELTLPAPRTVVRNPGYGGYGPAVYSTIYLIVFLYGLKVSVIPMWQYLPFIFFMCAALYGVHQLLRDTLHYRLAVGGTATSARIIELVRTDDGGVVTYEFFARTHSVPIPIRATKALNTSEFNRLSGRQVLSVLYDHRALAKEHILYDLCRYSVNPDRMNALAVRHQQT